MPALTLKFIRFIAVGLSSTLVYALLVALMVWAGGRPLLAVHCLAFALSLPYAYFAQRGFTFRYSGPHAVGFPRFLVVSLLSLIFSTGIVAAAKALRFDDAIAIAAILLFVPLFNFACMAGWVFAAGSPPGISPE